MSHDFLQHYGIKGMKWGVITGGKRGNAASREAATLSDRDLQKAVNRLNMEKQYVTLTAQKKTRERTSLERGRDKTLEAVQGLAEYGVKRAGRNVMEAIVDKRTR